MNGSLIVASLVGTLVLAPGAAQADLVADWRMNESKDAKVMRDAVEDGVRNKGKIVSVKTGVAGLAGGRAYEFAGDSDHVKVADSSELDPKKAKIRLAATVRIRNHAMKDDSYDVVRKGLAGMHGGSWKMEIKRKKGSASVGRLLCVFIGVVDGKNVAIRKQAPADIVNGKVHRLQCIRDGSTVRAVVDGVKSSTKGRLGSISNSAPVFLGCKKPGDDVLRGKLDRVMVGVG